VTWFAQESRVEWSAALAHLRAISPRMRELIEHVGPCTLSPRRDYFVTLCKAIFNQQLSMKAAATLFGRFRDHFPARRPTPAALLALVARDPQVLRRGGVSRQKNLYLIDLARHFASGEIPTRRLAAMNDDQVIEALTKVNGIGRWTAEMFLMFVLNRPDVLPVDDLGLRKGMQLFFNLRRPPLAKRMFELAEPWRPWRTVATWYIWRGFDLLKK
jgi:DNA-3-methyladenine glycosylase II